MMNIQKTFFSTTLAGALTLFVGLGMLPVRALAEHTRTRACPTTNIINSGGTVSISGSTVTLTGAEGSDCVYTRADDGSFELTNSGDTFLAVINGGVHQNDDGTTTTFTANAAGFVTGSSRTGGSSSSSSSSSSSNTGAVVGGVVGGAVGLGLLVWYFWPDSDDESNLVSFRELEANSYLPSRSWFGMEHAFTDNAKFALGSFWLSDGTVNTLTPSMSNAGLDVRLSLTTVIGEVSFSGAVFNYDDSPRYNENGIGSDFFDDSFTLNDNSEVGYAVGLNWRVLSF